MHPLYELKERRDLSSNDDNNKQILRASTEHIPVPGTVLSAAQVELFLLYSPWRYEVGTIISPIL